MEGSLPPSMDEVVDEMSNAYDNVLSAVADVIEANAASQGQRNAATDAALYKFKDRWSLFLASCDGAEQVVETARRTVASDRVADMACPIPPPERSAPNGLAPLSVPRLERGFRAIFSVEKALRHQNADGDTDAAAAAAATATAADSSPGCSDGAKPSEDEAK